MTKHNPSSSKSTGRILIGIIAFIVFIFYMGSDNRMAKYTSRQSSSSKQKSEVRNDIKYDLKEYDIIPNIKYSANIRLDRKLTKSELEYLANRIYKEKNIKDYQRAFLSYYLPNMEIGNGAWATTHFNPNLKVIILGLNNE